MAARQMSDAAKAKMREERMAHDAVNAYLSLLTNRPHLPRGRHVPLPVMRYRLEQAEEKARTSVGVRKLEAIANARRLRDRIQQTENADSEVYQAKLQEAEAEFVKHAKRYAQRRGLLREDFVRAEVPVSVLRKAGL